MKSLNKKKRIVDRELLDSYHDLICIIHSECFGHVVAHHIKTKGSGGDDVADNLLALCCKHHEEIHKIGTYTFCLKYGVKR